MSVVAKLRAEELSNCGLILDRDKEFSFFQSVQTGCEAYPVSLSVVNGGSFPYLCIVPRLRMSGGAMSTLPDTP